MAENKYGVDVAYFEKELDALKASLPRRTPEELARYLTTLADIAKEAPVMPQWTPEVGKLCSDDNGFIYEITEHVKIYRLKNIHDGSFSQPMTLEALAREYTPIAELEGLKVGAYVYTYGFDGKVHPFINEGEFQLYDFITLKNTQGGYRFNITLDGYFTILSDKQLFWRTADRAERFERGDA